MIFRNLVGDYGIDYLLTPPGRSDAEQIAGWEEGLSGTGLTWEELVRIAARHGLRHGGAFAHSSDGQIETRSNVGIAAERRLEEEAGAGAVPGGAGRGAAGPADYPDHPFGP